MTLLRPNNVSLGEALCTEEVVFSDNALSCGYFIVTLDTYALDMVVVLAESFRFPWFVFDKHFKWIERLSTKVLTRHTVSRLVELFSCFVCSPIFLENNTGPFGYSHLLFRKLVLKRLLLFLLSLLHCVDLRWCTTLSLSFRCYGWPPNRLEVDGTRLFAHVHNREPFIDPSVDTQRRQLQSALANKIVKFSNNILIEYFHLNLVVTKARLSYSFGNIFKCCIEKRGWFVGRLNGCFNGIGSLILLGLS